MTANRDQKSAISEQPDISVARRALITTPLLAASEFSTAAVPGDHIKQALHTIQRITMGVTPELMAEIKTLGVSQYIDQQLNPLELDDTLAESMLKGFKRIHQDTATLMAENKKGRVRAELNGATAIRAIYSKRQLQEVMVDFWSNHFNVDTNKKKTAIFKVAEDQKIRALALGRFSDLLMASAKSPAMLEYLDNRSSRANRNRIPNENYARELLELHTVGVEGGYDELDVQEVAYVFSGWTVEKKRYEFKFKSKWNDIGPLKYGGNILGWTPSAPSGLIENGESLLSHLAHLPETANYVCWKLCRHFVSDDVRPSDQIVRDTAKVFINSHTEIVPTLKFLFRSKAFRHAEGKKLKRANELMFAMLRATSPEFDLSNARLFGRKIRNMLAKHQHKIYEASAPTGYADIGAEFLNTSAMVSRWNLGLLLTSNRLGKKIRVRPSSWVQAPKTIRALIKQLSLCLLGRELEWEETESLYRYLGKSADSRVTQGDLAQLPILAGLIFASSSFQIR